MRLTNFVSKCLKDYSNLPGRYVERSKRQVYWRVPDGLNYNPQTIERKKFRYTTNRPWTGQFRQQNMPDTIRKKVFQIPIDNWGFFRGDRVEVLVGKDKGKQGIISQVVPERNWVIVEGINCHYKVVGGDKDYPGVLIKSEAPLTVDQHVSLVDPSDLKPTLVEWRFTEEGERVRVSLKTGRIIPVPSGNDETYDYKTKMSYVEREKDTKGSVISEVTFKPKLMTFEMEVMHDLGLTDSSNPEMTYWY